MSVYIAGLLLAFLAIGLLIAICVVILILIPASVLGGPAKAALDWLPPFIRGEALRDWAATTAEKLAKGRLASKRTAKTGGQLAKDMEEGAMRAMLPAAQPSELERIVACPEEGQGMIGVTAPEALNIAAFLRSNRSPEEVHRIHQIAADNVKQFALRAHVNTDPHPLPCPLHGEGHVCCTYGDRPLQCRPLHAMSIAKDLGAKAGPAETKDHEKTVAEGIRIGLTRSLRSAGLDARVYELNWALATALEKPDAAERWAKGENVFYTRKG